MAKLGECRSTFGKLSRTQKTVDLPAFDGTPAEIDISTNEMSVAIFIEVVEDFYLTIGDDAADGLTRIADDDTRAKISAGSYQFPIVGNTENIYIRKQAGALLADGLAYILVEGD